MAQKRRNELDELIVKIVQSLAQFDLSKIGEHPITSKLFEAVVNKVNDITLFEQVFKQQVFPFLNKAIVHRNEDIRQSAFKHILHFDTTRKDEVYEFVRLGYVGLFHKWENLYRSLLAIYDEHFSQVTDDKAPLTAYLQKRYNVQLTDQWRIFPVIWKINYITNSVKHNDGLPKQFSKDHNRLVPQRFRYYSPDQKINIEPPEFFEDLKEVRKLHEKLINLLQKLHIFRMNEETENSLNELIDADIRDKNPSGFQQHTEDHDKLIAALRDIIEYPGLLAK